ncbi:phosphoribosylformylglycinamidine cyclo-ligase [Eupransor demetentiae]|uniref:Phosphoribosylformylglycinamidine cyclo-ligase n=1 Tax=Eupransor demetentiae TaxID=3109584 RepID=A0ABP0ENP2_9LACO|nr:Phosphoribosylaminoimidazole (AIR) synthetase (PurM) [Lactobacillaceae bacterium LMG 33000]
MTNKSQAYSEAGIDIAAGNEAVELMTDAVQATYTPNVLSGIGGFGASYALPQDLKEPVLISGTDGVGTKLLIALMAQRHDTIGQDLVGMVVNDILTQGAYPAFMLDYLAVEKMHPRQVQTIVTGIAKAAKESGLALIGGESAEMPDIYSKGHYDLAAFAVGTAERSQLLNPEDAQAGDYLLGLPSSGIHSNGYSLVRRVFQLDEEGQTWRELDQETQNEFIEPTKLYTHALLPLLKSHLIQSAAHITGGGLQENLPRSFGKNLQAELEWGTWPILPIFDKIQARGQLSLDDMLETFNLGLGMVLTVKPADLKQVEAKLQALDEPYYRIGELKSRPENQSGLTFRGPAPW